MRVVNSINGNESRRFAKLSTVRISYKTFAFLILFRCSFAQNIQNAKSRIFGNILIINCLNWFFGVWEKCDYFAYLSVMRSRGDVHRRQ